MREKKIFLHILLFQCITLYQKRQKITPLDTIEFFDTHACINNPHSEGSGIIIFLRKYYIVISDALGGSFLDALFLLFAVYYQSFMGNQEGIKIQLQKILHRRICVRDITTFMTAHLPFYAICCFFCGFPFTTQVTDLLIDLHKDAQYSYGWYSV